MSKYYFLQESMAAIPFMMILLAVSVLSILLSVYIIIKTTGRIKKEAREFKADNIKKDGTFIIINFTIAAILVGGAVAIFFKIINITFD